VRQPIEANCFRHRRDIARLRLFGSVRVRTNALIGRCRPPHARRVTSDRATYRQVLSNRMFRLLVVSKTMAIAAVSLRIFALSTMVYATTRSPLWAASVFGVGFLPQIAGSALFGAAADRFAPRPLIVGGYVVESLTAAVLAGIAMPAWTVVVMLGLAACLAPVPGGASSRLVAQALPGDLYVLGRSLFTVASSAAQVGGLAVGGVALTVLGSPRHSLIIVATLYGTAALLIGFRLPLLPAGVRDGRSLVKSTWAGTTMLLADGEVRRLLLVQWLPAALATGAEGLLVPYAAERGFATVSAGLLLSCMPAGMLAGDVAIARLAPERLRERLVGPLIAVVAIPLIVIGALRLPLIVVVVLVSLSAIGLAYAMGMQRRFVDAVPAGRQGQAFGLLSAGLTTSMGLSPLALGAIAAAVGTPAALAAAGIAALGCLRLVPRARGTVRVGHPTAILADEFRK
jgi:hypothetical protein